MDDEKTNTVEFLSSSIAFFSEIVQDAIEKRKIQTTPQVSYYLVSLLNTNLIADNMQVQGTFAEMLLRANQSEKNVRRDLLKKLGDTSLYVSGFFGESLKRKVVDIDYYADIGGMAYGRLAADSSTEGESEVFNEFSRRFLDYVDLLTYISQNTLIQSNQDLLRLYERYVRTGSELARDQLMEKGLLTSEQIKKGSNQ